MLHTLVVVVIASVAAVLGRTNETCFATNTSYTWWLLLRVLRRGMRQLDSEVPTIVACYRFLTSFSYIALHFFVPSTEFLPLIFRKMSDKEGFNEVLIEPLRQFARDSMHLVKKCTKPDRKEFTNIARAVGLGFTMMGFIGFFVKLIHIPINNILVGN